MGQVVAIVGRPNVGKSTLFNRLIGERKAIIENISGVTRDRIYDFSHWNGKNFTVIDTGGYVKNSDDVFESAIREQAVLAMEEADIILFMVDVMTGITDLDEEIANILRKSKKHVFLIVNKVDSSTRQLMANEFWSLGFENTFFLSSMTGTGTGEILDAATELMPADDDTEKEEIPKIAIIGQPNVGKSSLTNALLGEERNIVTDIAGTTRDSIHTKYDKFGKKFLLIDTAGIRRKARVHENIEFYSVMRAIRALEEADICLLMIDATAGIEAQDLNIFSLAQKRKKGLIILVNKWDLVEDKETNTAKEYTQKIHRRIAPFVDLPIIFVSATEKTRIFKAIDVAMDVHKNRSRRVSTSKLNELLQEAMIKNPPPAYRGKYIKIKYATQLDLAYPCFVFFCNHPQFIKESYRNYLENQLRENYDFHGVPLTLYFRNK